MIVAERKPFDEIKDMLAGLNKVFVLGCDTCVSVCMVGGKKEVGVLASQLRMSFKKDGREIHIDEDTVERQCNREYMELVLNKLGDYDAVLTLACGAGAQLLKFEKKIQAGAEFFQTQAVYDLDNFKRFMDYAGRFDVKILAGIVLLVSARMAKFMNQNVAGIFVPEKLVAEMESVPREEQLKKGIEITGRMIRKIKEQSICHGVHIMAIGKEHVVPDILRAAGLLN